MAPQHDKPGKAKAKAKPVTAHPLFPAVVALWFGALFGLGSLAIRVGLLETVVLASRIDTVIPAAAPPLGVSARILLALVLAALGALIGATIARRIARPKPEVRERKRNPFGTSAAPVSVRARDSHPDAPARKPISAHEELGSEPVFAGRRRSMLALAQDDEREFMPQEFAPLPGGMPQLHDAYVAEEALELGDFAAGSDDYFAPSVAAAAEIPAFQPRAAYEPVAERQQFMAVETAELVPVDVGSAPLDFAPPADAMEGRQVFGMAHRQPDEVLDRLGITDAEFEDLPPVAIPAAHPAFGEPTSAEIAAVGEPELPTDKVGMVELAERLAQSMQRRRERAVQARSEAEARAAAANQIAIEFAAIESIVPHEPIAAEPVFAIALDGLADPVASDPAALAGEALASVAMVGFAHPNDIPAPPVPSTFESASAVTTPFAAMPAALRPVGYGDDGLDEDEALASLLPLRQIAMPSAPSFAAPTPVTAPEPANEPDPSEEAVPEESFSSLLDLNQPAPVRQTFIRIEESEPVSVAIEPVVIFPGQAARPFAVEPAGVDVSDDANTFRRFDAPASAEAGQQVAASVAPAHDAAEAERALRAALANLQQMSGAA